jgi:eukaryotic-like serine/threonine-protein kinase
VLWPRATPQPRAATPPPLSAVAPVLEIVELVDLGDKVKLTWSTTDDQLFVGVVVWAEGEPSRTHLPGFDRTMTVPVEPGPKYCFMARGTAGDQIVESQSRAVRGADCRK